MTKRNDDAPLSPAELEVLRLIQQGLSSKEVANKLCIEKRTVDAQLNRSYRKLKVTNRVQALREAYKLGLLIETNNSISYALPNSD